nr:MAG TPA: hypothetical protein [Caudoviricetes sp.]
MHKNTRGAYHGYQKAARVASMRTANKENWIVESITR